MSSPGIFDFDREAHSPIRPPKPCEVTHVQSRRMWAKIVRAIEEVSEEVQTCRSCGGEVAPDEVCEYEAGGFVHVYHEECFRKACDALLAMGYEDGEGA